MTAATTLAASFSGHFTVSELRVLAGIGGARHLPEPLAWLNDDSTEDADQSITLQEAAASLLARGLARFDGQEMRVDEPLWHALACILEPEWTVTFLSISPRSRETTHSTAFGTTTRGGVLVTPGFPTTLSLHYQPDASSALRRMIDALLPEPAPGSQGFEDQGALDEAAVVALAASETTAFAGLSLHLSGHAERDECSWIIEDDAIVLLEPGGNGTPTGVRVTQSELCVRVREYLSPALDGVAQQLLSGGTGGESR